MNAVLSTIVTVRAVCSGIVTCLLLSSTVWSQSHPFRFEHITTNDGLTQDIVTAIVEDSRGFMWFGTENGLNRYDGYSIRTYKNNPFDSTSLSDNSVTALMVDTRGRLWIAAGGVNLYDERTDRFIRFVYIPYDPFSLPPAQTRALCQDSSGSIWAGTDEGLAKLDFHTKRWARYLHDPSDPATLNSNVVRSLLTDRKGALWVGTENGLNRYDAAANKFFRVSLNGGSRGTMVNSIFEDQRGTLWLGTNGRGLVGYDPVSLRVKRYSRSGPVRRSPGDDLIFSVQPDRRGRLWVGHFGGFDIFDPQTETFEHHTQSPGEPDAIAGSRVYAIYPDKRGTVWLGTYHGGVERYDPHRQKFALFRPVQERVRKFADENILSVREDSRGRVWLGTEAGVSVMDQSFDVQGPDLQPSAVVPKINAGRILSIFEDDRHAVWVGRDKPGTLDRINLRGEVTGRFPFPGVRAICEDPSGDLWFGTREDGLVRFSPTRGVTAWYRNRPQDPDSLWGDGVWCVFADHDGGVWVGTSGDRQCLNRFDRRTGRFTHIVHRVEDPGSIPGSNVRAIYEDAAGVFWIGLWGSGLTRFDPSSKRFTVYLENEGLASLYVKGILADGRNKLWISTERGISRFDPATGQFRNYTTDDGLQGDRFYSGSCATGMSGTMYFGGEHGLNVFRPDSIRDDSVPPVVRLTSFKVFDKPAGLPDAVWNMKEIELSYNQDFISFEFVALDYSSPRRNRYAYKLEGFDRNWVDAGDRRYAAYTHLDGGTYTFRVKGANGDGVWNDSGASVDIIIHPPFWETIWFRILAVLTIAGILYGSYRIRLARLLAVERLRQRIAQDLHDDIGTNLSTIALASQSLGRRRGSGTEAREALERIGSVAQRTTEQMKDIVWVLKTNNDSLDDIIIKMREAAGQLLKGIRFQFAAPAGGFPGKVDLEFKRNVFLFYKECLNNVVKHSRATEVKIHIDYGDGRFVMQVDDNGKGFVEEGITPGSGLQNLRARGKQMNGDVTIDSKPGRGTHVSLVVKMT